MQVNYEVDGDSGEAKTNYPQYFVLNEMVLYSIELNASCLETGTAEYTHP